MAVFFNTPGAKPIIKVIGFSILFQAFTNIGITYFKKELEFNKEFIYQFSGTLADFVVAVSAVLILKNVWALVFGLLAGNVVRCLVSYLIHPYRPHLSSDLGKAKELFGFGKWNPYTKKLVKERSGIDYSDEFYLKVFNELIPYCERRKIKYGIVKHSRHFLESYGIRFMSAQLVSDKPYAGPNGITVE